MLQKEKLRQNVIIRKITFGNRSPAGARKHEIIMSIIQTVILNKVEPLRLFLALTIRDISFLEEIIQIRGP